MSPRTTARERPGVVSGVWPAVVMRVVFVVVWLVVTVVVTGWAGIVSAGATEALAAPPPPPDTVNEFIPENRNLGDCLGALQRPGCGSEASGGWRQGLIFLAMLGGLMVIAARIIISTRRRAVTVDTE